MTGYGHEFLKAEVAANQRRLEQCGDHDFKPITPGLFGTKYRCYRCTGEVDGLSARWYNVGRQHGTMSGTSG